MIWNSDLMLADDPLRPPTVATRSLLLICLARAHALTPIRGDPAVRDLIRSKTSSFRR